MSIAQLRQRIRVPHPAHPVLLMLPVVVLAAAVTTSTSIVRVDALLGSLARGAVDGVSPHVGYLVSTLGGTDLVLPLTAASALLLCLLRHWRGAVALVVAVLGTQIVVDLIKGAIERPRPAANEALAQASGASFPSAHSATSMALYAMLAFLLARRFQGAARIAVACVGGTVVVAVGLSRVMLAAHYPIDVVAGWLTGAAVVTAAWLLVRRLRAPRLLTQPS